jgi:hypothetical protein
MMVNARPPGSNAGSLSVEVVSGAPKRHHTHDPSTPIKTSRRVPVSTNAIARPLGEKRGCVG